MSCCGVDNYKDFNKARPWMDEVAKEGTGLVVPASCCILKSGTDSLLMVPQYAECPTSPSESNSFLNTVSYQPML